MGNFRVQYKRRRDSEGEDHSPVFSARYNVFGARIAIMIMLAVLIGMVTIFTWHFTAAYSTKSIKALAYSLRVELLKRTISRSWNVISSTLDATTTLVHLSDFVIGRSHSALNSSERSQERHFVMRNITWAVFESRQSVKTLSIVYENGQLQGYERNFLTNETYYVYSPKPNNISEDDFPDGWYREELDPSTGKPIKPPVSMESYNLTRFTGNISRLSRGDTFWHVSVGTNENESLLASASNVRHPSTGKILASVVVTSALSGVSSLMRDLAKNYSGYFYLTSIDGFLLATSSSDQNLVRTTSTGPELVPAIEANDPTIRRGARWLQQNHGDSVVLRNEVHVGNVLLGDTRFYIDSFYWNLTGLPLVGVILLPRSYVLGEVDQRGRTTLIILISVAFCILVIGCLLIFIFTSGVSNEMKLRAELIKHLNARRRAEASSTYKSQFLANMSHELRTPMAAVIGLLDILLTDAYLTSEQTAMVSQIRHCSTALLRLLNNILDLSKVESGKLILEKVDFNLKRELEAVVDMFSVQCNGIDIILDLDDDMPSLVRGDLTRTVQIFANLIGNSVKFTSSGHIIVRGWSEPFPPASIVGCSNNSSSLVFSEGADSGKLLLWFEIEDSGCGIDPSKWETVFDSFVQADTSTSRTHGGTGLGLCIVRSLVNKMGGEINVVKKNSPGTLMRFVLQYDSPLESVESPLHLFRADAFSFHFRGSKVILGMEGVMIKTVLAQWLVQKKIQVFVADDWKSMISILEDEILAASEKNQLLVILDTKLLSQTMEVVESELKLLNRLSERGAMVSWVLNHDTPVILKTKIRENGYGIMANKPMYKSKLLMLLSSLEVGGGYNGGGDDGDFGDGDGGSGDGNRSRGLSSSSEYTHDSTWSGKDSTKALERLSARMDCILGEVVNHVNSQRYQIANGSDMFNASVNGSAELISMHPANGSAEEDYRSEKSSVTTVTDIKNQSNGGSLQGIHILLAEDTPVIQKVAVVLLKKLGASVVAVADGQAAVDVWKTNVKKCGDENHVEFDLILMDCQMPRMDGYDATKAIRRAEEECSSKRKMHIPIVALTAHAMSCDEERCLEVGMDAYLTKPIDYKLMATTILSLTKKSWRRR